VEIVSIIVNVIPKHKQDVESVKIRSDFIPSLVNIDFTVL